MRPGRFAGGAQSDHLTAASSRTWQGSTVSAAPVPPGRALRIPQVRGAVNVPLSVTLFFDLIAAHGCSLKANQAQMQAPDLPSKAGGRPAYL